VEEGHELRVRSVSSPAGGSAWTSTLGGVTMSMMFDWTPGQEVQSASLK